ncbi:DUF2809 domain-containing protein [Tenacibaculum sp. TC6]|uniref:ribosomal maturation YjgA family protein n=1 Tax=Tenacibaculum sp. TC6 TaxID=3423223 RepID=UPI003D36C7CB
MKFHLKYFIVFLILLLVEFIIAQTKGFIRNTMGDFLVVILLFYLLKSFFKITTMQAAICVLIFSFVVELLQLTSFLEVIGLQNNRWAKIIFGATFSVGDLIAYTLGITTVVLVEKRLARK